MTGINRTTGWLAGVAMMAGVCALPATVDAWGFFGHRTTGYLAEKELEPAAREAVEELLGEESLADVAPWADRVRPDRPASAPLHYMNAPRGVIEPSEEDFAVPQGNVHSAVLGYAERLADETLPQEERAEALKFLVHFIGDLHQPLHCGYADDRGANDYHVMFDGRRSNLHRVWDTQILTPHLDGEPHEFADYLFGKFSDEQRAEWAAVDDPADWVIEARTYLFQGFYPDPLDGAGPDGEPMPVIGDAYLEVWLPTAEQQLARAGTRLDAPPIPFPPGDRQDFGPAEPVFPDATREAQPEAP